MPQTFFWGLIKAFLSFFALFIFYSQCISISPALFLWVKKKKTTLNEKSVTEINHVFSSVWRLPNSFSLLFSHSVTPHPHPQRIRLPRIKCNYDGLRVEEEHNACVSHLSHKWTQRRVTLGTVLDQSKKKTKQNWTTLDNWPNGPLIAHWFVGARRIHWKLQERRIPPVGSVW